MTQPAPPTIGARFFSKDPSVTRTAVPLTRASAKQQRSWPLSTTFSHIHLPTQDCKNSQNFPGGGGQMAKDGPHSFRKMVPYGRHSIKTANPEGLTPATRCASTNRLFCVSFVHPRLVDISEQSLPPASPLYCLVCYKTKATCGGKEPPTYREGGGDISPGQRTEPRKLSTPASLQL